VARNPSRCHPFAVFTSTKLSSSSALNRRPQLALQKFFGDGSEYPLFLAQDAVPQAAALYLLQKYSEGGTLVPKRSQAVMVWLEPRTGSEGKACRFGHGRSKDRFRGQAALLSVMAG
jgi:hypothetical protein